WPLWPAFRILPVSFLSSWRVRDRIQVLAWKASRSGCESAARQLRALHIHLLGRENGRGTDATLMAQHLWFGHQRVLALLRITGERKGQVHVIAEIRRAWRRNVTSGQVDELHETGKLFFAPADRRRRSHRHSIGSPLFGRFSPHGLSPGNRGIERLERE